MHKVRIWWAVGAAIIIVLGLAAYGFYKASHTPRTPYDAFWNALTTAVTTDGITCTVHDKTAGRDNLQAVSLDLVSKANATSKTTLEQSGSTVKTEGISTASDDYVRYTQIQTSIPNKKLDFSSVLNVWGKQSHGSSASLFEQTVLGGCVVPLAKLSNAQAADLVTDMKKNKVFQADYSHPAKASVSGTAVLRYATMLPPDKYIPFMKRFAAAYGLQSLNTLDASSFSGRAPENITLDIAADTDRLYEISFTGQNHTIQFSDYDKRPHIIIPSKTIPMAELEQRLQSIK